MPPGARPGQVTITQRFQLLRDFLGEHGCTLGLPCMVRLYGAGLFDSNKVVIFDKTVRGERRFALLWLSLRAWFARNIFRLR